MASSHEPAGAPLRTALRTTALAPMINNCYNVLSPIFEVLPNICLPPVERWIGVKPIQAAESRPFSKTCGGGAKARITVAVTGPPLNILRYYFLPLNSAQTTAKSAQ